MSEGGPAVPLGGIFLSIVSLWALWFHGTLWSMAAGLASPFDVLTQAILIVVWIWGSLWVALFVLVFLIGVLAVVEKILDRAGSDGGAL